MLQPEDEEEDVGEGPDRIGVPSEHHVRESNVVVHGDVSSGDAGEEGLLVEVDPVEHAEGERVVAEEDVDAEEAEDGEVAEVVVEGDGTVLAARDAVE